MIKVKIVNINLMLCLCLSLAVLSGCNSKHSLVDTNKIPGHKFSSMMQFQQKDEGYQKDEKTGLVRTKSGIYIYKDNTTINTTGYNFKIKNKEDVGPADFKFDAEKSNLRY